MPQYNHVRLSSSTDFSAPKDMLPQHQQETQADRNRKLEAAREQRKNRRQRAASRMTRITSGWPTTRPCGSYSRFRQLDSYLYVGPFRVLGHEHR
jgi:hypothetical protein